MLKNFLTRLIGSESDKALARLGPLVDRCNALEPDLMKLTDAELRAKTDEFKARLADGETLDQLMPEAFAVVREASRRVNNMRHYDVQLIGGAILHQGKIAEMRTGEGKTLVATLPLYLNALTGKGVHLVTQNDYLAKRDAQWMGRVYHFLGLRTGVIQSAGGGRPDDATYEFDPTYPSTDDRFLNLRPIRRKQAYECDITYGTNNEFGFDYLRDNMTTDLAECVQRVDEDGQPLLYFAVIDEVDNLLIDEARTPLIISGPADEPSGLYKRFAELVRRLEPSKHNDFKNPDGDYIVDLKARNVTLTEQGISKIERWLGIDNLYAPEHAEMTPYLDNALRAHALYERDRDYVVSDKGEIIIVDEFTGRLMHGRRFSEGLHQAIEAKEGVRVQRESFTYATITFQNFFKMYEKLAGMTGTAMTEAEEFFKIYNLEVVPLPTHIEYQAMQKKLIEKQDRFVDGSPVTVYVDPQGQRKYYKRLDYPDLVYKTAAAKFRAVVNEIEATHKTGRPVLVGTIAIETSEMLSRMLDRRGIPHQVLNAKQHEKEAVVIAQAGRSGAVTIATNMAGRGVDILLGGNPEGIARERLRKAGKDLTQISPEEWQAALEEARRETEAVARAAFNFGRDYGKPVRYITIGKKGREFIYRRGGQIIADFSGMPSRPTLLDTTPATRTAIDDFLGGAVDEVYLIYTEFASSTQQRPVVKRLLPLVTDELLSGVARTGPRPAYEFEPDPAEILNTLLPRLTELQVYQAVLESIASFYTAQRIAMRNATDNASDLIVAYTLSYNKARQAAITNELLDIASGAEALRKAVQEA
jgi:preprotein translocase subunit SecA